MAKKPIKPTFDSVASGSKGYKKAYDNRQLGTFNPATNTFESARMLDEVVVTPKNKETFNENIREGGRKVIKSSLELMGEPQKNMVEAITGKHQTPSQAWGFNDKRKWSDPGLTPGLILKDAADFTLDAVADPTNILGGAGFADALFKGAATKVAYGASKKIKDVAYKSAKRLDEKYIYPIQYAKDIKSMKKYAKESIDEVNSWEGKRRIKNTGAYPVKPDFDLKPKLTFDAGEGSSYYHIGDQKYGRNVINMNFRQLDRFRKKEGLNFSNEAVFDHELGHAIQGLNHQVEPGILSAEGKWLTNPDGSLIPNPERYIKPNEMDKTLSLLPTKSAAKIKKAVEAGEVHPITLDNLAYMKKHRDGVEVSPFFREMRSDMKKQGFIKNTYDDITEDDLKAFMARNPKDRITSIIDTSMPGAIEFLKYGMNKLPSVALPAAGVVGATQVNQGSMKKKKKYQEGGLAKFMGKNPNAIGAIGSAGSGIIDAIDPQNQYGVQSTGGAMASSALKYGAMGASLGPIGMAAGAVIGAGVGLFTNNKAKKVQATAEAAQLAQNQAKQFADSETVLANYNNAGTGMKSFNMGGIQVSAPGAWGVNNTNYKRTARTFKEGGLRVDQGNLQPISDSAYEVQGDNPNLTDDVGVGNASLDHNEIAKKAPQGLMIYSDTLKPPGSKLPYSKLGKKLEKQKSIEGRNAKQDELIDFKMQKLFQMQQLQNNNSHGESVEEGMQPAGEQPGQGFQKGNMFAKGGLSPVNKPYHAINPDAIGINVPAGMGSKVMSYHKGGTVAEKVFEVPGFAKELRTEPGHGPGAGTFQVGGFKTREEAKAFLMNPEKDPTQVGDAISMYYGNGTTANRSKLNAYADRIGKATLKNQFQDPTASKIMAYPGGIQNMPVWQGLKQPVYRGLGSAVKDRFGINNRFENTLAMAQTGDMEEVKTPAQQAAVQNAVVPTFGKDGKLSTDYLKSTGGKGANGINWNNAAGAIGALAPTIANMAAVRKIPQAAPVQFNKPARLNKLDFSDQALAIKQGLRASTLAGQQNSVMGQAQTGQIGDATSRYYDATNQMYGQANRLNTQIGNEQAQMNLRNGMFNTNVMNEYEQAKQARDSNVWSVQSGLRADFGNKMQGLAAQNNQMALDNKKLDMQREYYNWATQGGADRHQKMFGYNAESMLNDTEEKKVKRGGLLKHLQIEKGLLGKANFWSRKRR